MGVAAENPVSRVVPLGDRLASLVAMRDRLAEETDDTRWQRHKAECRCVCGMGDGRLLAALSKELREVMREIEAIPGAEGKTRLDEIEARVAEQDAHRRSRATRTGA